MKRILVLSAYISETHAREVLSGIRKCAREHACSAVIYTCKMRYQEGNRHDAGEFIVFDLPKLDRYDGIIIAGSTIFSDEVVQSLIKRAEESGRPAVSLEKYSPSLINVAIDNKSAMKELLRHVITEHGYKRINYIAGVAGNVEALDRYAAYTETLAEYGIPFESERVFWGDWLRATGERAVEAFWKSSLPKPEVIVCSSDKNALGAHVALTAMGLRVPQDVALTGFDDDLETRYYIPGITTVAREPVLAGYRACEAVLAGMRAEDRGRRIAINTHVECRESCGCNHPVPVEEKQFRKLYFLEKDRNEKLISRIDDMSVDLTMASTFAQLQSVLRKHAGEFGCDAFYVSIFDNILSPGTIDFTNMDAQRDVPAAVSGSGRSTLLFAYEDGKFLEDIHVDADTYLASRTGDEKTRGCYVVNPLHFGEILFGCTVIKNSELPFDSELFYTMITDIGNAIQTIKCQQQKEIMLVKLENMWGFDTLTGVYNRAGFHRYGERIWRESIAHHVNAMLLFADLDGLKRINDTFGHDEGDKYIRALADIFRASRRHGEVVMRYGGDEFVVIASNVTQAYAEEYVLDIQERIRMFNEDNDGLTELSASVGYILITPQEGDALEEAIYRADKQMYNIKKAR